jgi:N-acetylmuramic acid 6-phosphate etherase
LTAKDAVVGIAASGRTPYTIGAIEFARELGCFTACIVCNPESRITQAAEIAIVPVVGPEAVTGSTRMKAGTAQKMVLNMISTVAMIRLGYVSGNRMTNMKASNEKLHDRAVRILMDETKIGEAAAAKLMEDAGGDLRVALVMLKARVNAQRAESALAEKNYVVDDAVRCCVAEVDL